MNTKKGLTSLTFTLMLLGILLLTGCDNSKSNQQQAQLPTVGVVTLKAQPINISTELPGRTVAYRIAEVRPQVSGIILKREFIEGSQVQQGQPLYQIDAATYKAAYDQAKGQLLQDEAQAKLSELTVERYKPLLKTKYISQQDYDKAIATAKQAQALVASAKANLEQAAINLKYTQVTAPIAGTIGKSNVTEGALVTSAQANALTTIQQLDPIYVDVTQSSTDFLQLKKEIASGAIEKTGGKASVSLKLDDDSTYSLKGTLEFSEVNVDQSTGSITLRAIFPNPEHILLPGMFVRAKLDEGVKKDAILVPQRGVTRDPRGQATTMIVNAEGKVEAKIIKTGQAIGDEWVVTDGLNAGDKVIVNGLMQFGVKPGASVLTEEYQSSSEQHSPSITTQK